MNPTELAKIKGRTFAAFAKVSTKISAVNADLQQRGESSVGRLDESDCIDCQVFDELRHEGMVISSSFRWLALFEYATQEYDHDTKSHVEIEPYLIAVVEFEALVSIDYLDKPSCWLLIKARHDGKNDTWTARAHLRQYGSGLDNCRIGAEIRQTHASACAGQKNLQITCDTFDDLTDASGADRIDDDEGNTCTLQETEALELISSASSWVGRILKDHAPQST